MLADNLSMKIRPYYAAVLLCFTGIAPHASVADDARQEKGVKVNGVVFNIAKDRKIEKIGGVYNPEGIDKYVDRRFVEMTERLQKIELQLDETNKKLDIISTQLVVAEKTPVIVTKDNSQK